ncbi:MAG: hypothetical protein VX484_08490 [Chloroflexota bacterium]|nr:hypothetical protein [Chloroflexota bacterium]
MSVIPNGYGSSIYLDMERVLSNDALTTLISPETLGDGRRRAAHSH